MRLFDLFSQNEPCLHGFSNMEIGKPCMDTRLLQKKDVFFFENSASYLTEAIERGACAVVTDETTPLPTLPVPVLLVKHVRKAYARAWQEFTGHPEKSLRLFAVTGTNGKTSVAHFLSEIFRYTGMTVGKIGTVALFDGANTAPSDYTTPPPEILYPLLSEMRKNGVKIAVMEASSHALAQNRLHGLTFDCAIFTNLTRDHLDYHKTEAAYKAAKAALFRQAEHSLLNLDDPAARELAFEAAGDVYYYAENTTAEFEIEDPICTPHSIRYILHVGDMKLPIEIPLVGRFHIHNSAAAIACAYLAGIPCKTLYSAANRLTAPPGRLEKLKTDTPYAVYIDYAHTPDALEKSLSSLRPFTKRLTVVFGAGGERDRGKRPEMGSAAERFADRIILTNDNPRAEAPEQILADIQKGILQTETITIPDRKDAILYALSTACEGEILLLAGKGHEAYLIDQNGKHDFSEREIICQYLERKGQRNVSQHE